MARPGQCILVSTLHQLIAFTLDFSYIPDNIKAIIMSYFQDMHICIALQKFPTGWQQLEVEVGIAMGCAISPVLLVVAFKVILIGCP